MDGLVPRGLLYILRKDADMCNVGSSAFKRIGLRDLINQHKLCLLRITEQNNSKLVDNDD